MFTNNRGTQIFLGIVLTAAVAVVIFCAAIKMGFVQSDFLTSEFKPKGNTLEELAESVVEEVITEDMNEYQKYKVLHDWLINYAKYDQENTNTKSESMHNGAVVLRSGTGVSDAYAYAYQALCKSANLYCAIVQGNAGDRYKDHVWNIVRINNGFYHIDCTWDDTDTKNDEGKEQIYEYFLLSDKTMKSKGRTFENQNCTSTVYESVNHYK